MIRLAGPALELLNFPDSMEHSQEVAPLLRSQQLLRDTAAEDAGTSGLAAAVGGTPGLATGVAGQQRVVAAAVAGSAAAPALPASRRLPPAASWQTHWTVSAASRLAALEARRRHTATAATVQHRGTVTLSSIRRSARQRVAERVERVRRFWRVGCGWKR